MLFIIFIFNRCSLRRALIHGSEFFLLLTSFGIHSYKEGGVFIIQDSSANKCGVICSSYEIAAAMLLNEEEFFDNKEVIVNQVLDKLRNLARMEAELLFNEYESYPGENSSMVSLLSFGVHNELRAINVFMRFFLCANFRDFRFFDFIQSNY